MIAVVSNSSNRACFLRENDPVLQQCRQQDQPDSVYFKENFLDLSGRVRSREVVKRLSGALEEEKGR